MAPSTLPDSTIAVSVPDWWQFWTSRLSTLILVGLITGIGCGIFFGEYCAPLKLVGDIYVGLLQMTVLPYIAVELIANLGRLSLAKTRRLACVAGLVLLALWGLTLATVFLLAAGFPSPSAGSFYSSALVEPSDDSSLLAMFIPRNIFHSLAENQVPAIVLFCICAGIALATVKNRRLLIDHLDVLSSMLIRIAVFITKLTPIGVFAISAGMAGTIAFDEIVRLQAYLVMYTAGAIFLGVIVVPLLVTTLTPLTYGEVMRIAKEPMLTAFATGKLVIVLPMLIENTERLLRQHPANGSEDDAPSVQVLYATAYPFPHTGKLLSMLFIPFAAWFIGNVMKLQDYPAFLAGGLFAYFGGPLAAIPYLLDQMQLPRDMFQLFLLSGVWGERVGDAVGAMHLAALTLISTFGFRGGLRWDPLAAAKYGIVVTLFGLITLSGVRYSLSLSSESIEKKSDVIARMQLIDQPVSSIVFRQATPNPNPLLPGETLIQRIRRTGIMRIGYNEDKVPFAFFNERGNLVGFDINLAHALARDLGVVIEFVRFDRATLAQQLAEDDFDFVMSGLVGTLERSEIMPHTSSYMDVTLALVVPDYRAGSFRTLESMRSIPYLRIGFVDLSRGFVARLQDALPDVELIEIRNNRDFFEGKEPELDALLISAESGSTFSLLYPNYEVVVPSDLRVKLPLFYAIGARDFETRDFLEHWITLRRKDGTMENFYDYWVLGRTAEPDEPRWSVIRNVLHWVD